MGARLTCVLLSGGLALAAARSGEVEPQTTQLASSGAPAPQATAPRSRSAALELEPPVRSTLAATPAVAAPRFVLGLRAQEHLHTEEVLALTLELERCLLEDQLALDALPPGELLERRRLELGVQESLVRLDVLRSGAVVVFDEPSESVLSHVWKLQHQDPNLRVPLTRFQRANGQEVCLGYPVHLDEAPALAEALHAHSRARRPHVLLRRFHAMSRDQRRQLLESAGLLNDQELVVLAEAQESELGLLPALTVIDPAALAIRLPRP